MAETLKYIIQKLNDKPFNKEYNLVTFDSLKPVQLLQIVVDVIGEIEEKVYKINVYLLF